MQSSRFEVGNNRPVMGVVEVVAPINHPKARDVVANRACQRLVHFGGSGLLCGGGKGGCSQNRCSTAYKNTTIQDITSFGGHALISFVSALRGFYRFVGAVANQRHVNRRAHAKFGRLLPG